MASLQAVHNEPDPVPSNKKEANWEPHPIFGLHPNTQGADFNFKKAVKFLPLKLNLGNFPLDREPQVKFSDLMYSNQEVFSLHDKTYDYWVTHTILTSTNKPVYLLHRTILRLLQGSHGIG